MRYPRIVAVKPLVDKKVLIVTFDNGDIREYNCSPLFSDPNFSKLKEDWFFNRARVENFGYGIVWDEQVDLSESEIWTNGKSAVG